MCNFWLRAILSVDIKWNPHKNKYLSIIHLSVNPKIGQSNLKQAWNMLIKQKLFSQAQLSMNFKWVKSFCETPSCQGFYLQLN